MLTCTVLAGMLFVSNGPSGDLFNFSHASLVHLNQQRDSISLRIDGRLASFNIPADWPRDTAIAVMTRCARDAEERAFGQIFGAGRDTASY